MNKLSKRGVDNSSKYHKLSICNWKDDRWAAIKTITCTHILFPIVVYSQLQYIISNYKLFSCLNNNDSHSHTKPATRLRPKNVGITVKSYRERATNHSGCVWSYEQNHSQQAAITSRRQVLHGRTTNHVWSHHQSCVIVCQAVARSVVRPVTSCPDWLYVYVVCVSVRLLTIGEDDSYDQSWHDWSYPSSSRWVIDVDDVR